MCAYPAATPSVANTTGRSRAVACMRISRPVDGVPVLLSVASVSATCPSAACLLQQFALPPMFRLCSIVSVF